MNEVEADAAAGTQLCAECRGPVPPPELGAKQGRPRKYCGRGCQSKAYRRKKEQDRQQQLRDAVAAARVESPALDPGRDAPGATVGALEDVGTVDEDDDLDDVEAGPPADATPRELVEWHAAQTALFARRFLQDLDDGHDPDRAMRSLTFYASVEVARLFEAARQARHALREPRPAGAIAPWAEGLEEFAQLVAWKDRAALPEVHLAQHAATGSGPQEVPPVDPVARLGHPNLVLPMAAEDGLWDDWDIAGWRSSEEHVLVRHRHLVAGRVERVGTRWLAVGGRRYLREGLGTDSNKLRWFDSALDAATAVALWHQAQWEDTGDVVFWRQS
ncbi:hypothetical protein [Streptacidiphilus anmyonensis]|uniref:hypothetical protein n=1 Tax=Streptacidiphilus anmyonensis TaxID=405782 RepID=UPI0005A8D20B|nr:hypothetical protein [Streptacidiphilus anmyonensis]